MRKNYLFTSVMVLFLLSAGILVFIDLQEAKPQNHVLNRDTTFSIVVFPDTQVYPMHYPDTFINMTEWVVEHKEEYNIQFLLHEGDITNNNNHPQWINASRAMYVLNGSVPYTLNTGNHDLGPNGNAANRDTYLNDYFPSGPIENWTSWGGAYEKGHQENTYHYFSAGGRDWLVLALEMAPRDGVLEWANDVVEAHPDRLVLIVTHNYMVQNQRMTTLGGNYGIDNSPDGAANGEEIWQNFAKLHRNVMCVFSGHILYEWGWLVSNGMYGNPVFQMMHNFQMSGQGGQGYFRMLTFDMDNETVHVETYSSLLDEIKTVPEHRFSFQFDIFDYINDPPIILNPIDDFWMEEDQQAGYLDLDGNERRQTGLFFDPNFYQGDELDYNIFNGVGYQRVSLGNPVTYNDKEFYYMPNGTLKIMIPKDWHGDFRLRLQAMDTRGESVITDINIHVRMKNDPPIVYDPWTWSYGEPVPRIEGYTIICNEDEELAFAMKGDDPIDHDTVVWDAYSETLQMNYLNEETGGISFSPTNDDVGDHILKVHLSDETITTMREFIIRVENVNDPPMITTSDLPDAYEDEDFWFVIDAVDIDPTGDKLDWTLLTHSSFIGLDRRTGNLSCRPLQEHVGTHPLTVKVEDGNGGQKIMSFNLTVRNVNDPPVIYNPPSTFFMNEDEPSQFTFLEDWFIDPDLDGYLTYLLSKEGQISAVLTDDMTILITPRSNWSGTAEVNVTASDGMENISDVLRVIVESVNDPPYDPLVDMDRNEIWFGETVNASASVSDVDLDYGDTITFAWFSNITGRIGVGETMDLSLPSGHHMITMTATDEAGEFVQVNVELLVKAIPYNDTDDGDDDDTGGGKGSKGSNGVVIAVILMIVLLIAAGVVGALFYIKKKDGPPSEETNPNGDNPPKS